MALTDSERIHQFEATTGVEVTIHGDEARVGLACRVIDERQALAAQAVGLLDAFMRDRGEYDLSSIEVLAEKSPDGSDFSFRFSFTAARDPHEYGYTYFAVFFGCHAPPTQPFWPHKFTIGFW